ncbi:CheR family methyltransferase [Flavisolibacter tropicus]|uniref:CheR family methyltransferase n=1 Tax=Flavisolibacter tropicus TaxID=1492898 RepID=UPI0008360E2F|nr:CheR family methyltransferase [Flavisolibacter tropicus]
MPSTNNNHDFPVVAIGAADGGTEAMMTLLENLPQNTGMAFFYFQINGIESDAAKQLTGATEIPVIKAEENIEVKPDHLYVIDPDKPQMLSDGVLKPMVNLPESPHAGMPVSQFFTLLADQLQEKVIGILLSGSDVDGTLGLKAIKMGGGLTFVQDGTANFSTMPKNAISQGVVDLVLSPKEIAEELIKIGHQKEIYYTAMKELDEGAISNNDESLKSILNLLNRNIGVDFSGYKKTTIKRRIIRRMMLHKLDNLRDYMDYLKKHSGEANALYQDLLINVTTFFRDPDTSEYLKDTLFPKIIQSKTINDPIRIWVPACSTGQEAYSVAMMLIEALGDKVTSMPVQIFATDLSEVAINKARLGIYSKDDVIDVSPKRLERFFNKIDGSYRIIKSIRDMCVFATHNIAKDPPFSRLDLISCCNFLIYIDSILQKKIIATFHYSLLNNGYLVLGKSETVGASAYLFSQVEKHFKVFSKKKDATAKAAFEMNYRFPETDRSFGTTRKQMSQKVKNDEVDLDRVIDHILLKTYTPACVVVNNDLDILQFRGSTGLYLEPSPGKASLNLMKMARQGLGFELRNLVHKAKMSGAPARKIGMEIYIEDKIQRINIEATPIKTEGEDAYFMVLFTPALSLPDDEELGDVKDKRVKQLEAELTALREDMRSIIESQEAANEELQSANEEIVSSNEELQSINEELETSKEEIESSNEELITINQELQMRNEQLAEVQEYSEAMFNIIRESVLTLDKELRVKTANRAFYKTFKINEEDAEGRYIFELGNGKWNIPKLRKLLHDIIPTNTQFFGYEIVHEFPNIGEKVLIINAHKVAQRIHGQELILLAIEDITEFRQAQRANNKK